ncbi:MAG: hypothetical protein E6G02_02330 [Actinobacteria bacterium]|nr:MAG: hypothetical protein E6G02_02330 [Actinomycetota bacterium]
MASQNFQVIPAVDLLGDDAVRLGQGDFGGVPLLRPRGVVDKLTHPRHAFRLTKTGVGHLVFASAECDETVPEVRFFVPWHQRPFA